ncbi:hypothetical protein CCR87_02485, partial [Rhodobaculum claviforme]|nr:hypothetical protein [Rhodobaculum claviforme]
MRAGLLAGLVVWLAALAGPGARAQEAAYLQIEARPDIAQARAAAARHAATLDNVVGYALGTGWYAIAVGPFADRAAAAQMGRSLRSAGMVPSDAFVVPAGRTAARFWPDAAAPDPT